MQSRSMKTVDGRWQPARKKEGKSFREGRAGGEGKVRHIIIYAGTTEAMATQRP